MKIPRRLAISVFTLVITLTSFSSFYVAGSGNPLSGLDESVEIQREGLARLRGFLGPDYFLPDSPLSDASLARRAKDAKRSSAPPPATITFKNPEASKFLVDGSKIPDGMPNSFPLVHRCRTAL